MREYIRISLSLGAFVTSHTLDLVHAVDLYALSYDKLGPILSSLPRFLFSPPLLSHLLVHPLATFLLSYCRG